MQHRRIHTPSVVPLGTTWDVEQKEIKQASKQIKQARNFNNEGGKE